MKRAARITAIERAVGQRKLVYFGTRAADAAALLALATFREVYAMSAALGSPEIDVDFALEATTGVRPDSRTYSFESDPSPAVIALRQALLRAFAEPTLVVAYKSRPFLAAIMFARDETAHLLAAFHDLQHALAHKPWVESSLRAVGVDLVPWRYHLTADDAIRGTGAAEWPVVVRTARSESGMGFALAADAAELAAVWPDNPDGFAAVAPYLSDAVPVNVNGVAFRDGSVSVHPASLQLIGIPWLTAQRFGYCGNDFAAIRDLDAATLDELDAMVRRVGRWLAQHGYIGAFGIDALVSGGRALLIEVNARFQGSSTVAWRLDTALDRSDQYLEHVAAYLGLTPADSLGLLDLTAAQPALAHAVALNTGRQPVARRADVAPAAGSFDVELLAPMGVRVEPGGVLLRAAVDHALTGDGFTVPAAFEWEVRTAIASFS